MTSSYPFSGYQTSLNGFNSGGLDFGGAVGNQFTNYAVLMFFADLATPGRALGGTITGRVQRVQYAPGATTPTYVPVVGAVISGVDAAGNPLFAQTSPGSTPMEAVSQQDGTYALIDRQYTGGTAAAPIHRAWPHFKGLTCKFVSLQCIGQEVTSMKVRRSELVVVILCSLFSLPSYAFALADAAIRSGWAESGTAAFYRIGDWQTITGVIAPFSAIPLVLLLVVVTAWPAIRVPAKLIVWLVTVGALYGIYRVLTTFSTIGGR